MYIHISYFYSPCLPPLHTPCTSPAHPPHIQCTLLARADMSIARSPAMRIVRRFSACGSDAKLMLAACRLCCPLVPWCHGCHGVMGVMGVMV